jgi:peptide deformylase
MVLPVVKYGHPALRAKGARIQEITPQIRALVADMIDTMRDARGVGLAAQQVGQALQLTVLDVRGVEDRPSTLYFNGEEADITKWMPMALVNPEFTPLNDPVAGPEGCLSFPEIYSDISRPESIELHATDLEGKPVVFRAGGLLGRAIQHEIDHLNGILFIDRMTRQAKEELRDELEALQSETKAELKKLRDKKTGDAR